MMVWGVCVTLDILLDRLPDRPGAFSPWWKQRGLITCALSLIHIEAKPKLTNELWKLCSLCLRILPQQHRLNQCHEFVCWSVWTNGRQGEYMQNLLSTFSIQFGEASRAEITNNLKHYTQIKKIWLLKQGFCHMFEQIFNVTAALRQTNPITKNNSGIVRPFACAHICVCVHGNYKDHNDNF